MQVAHAPIDVSQGTLLGERYELLGPIASGGMATVWLAHAHAAGGFKRLVAVKTCLPQLRADQDFVSMFLDEARIAAAIHHPNVIATLDLGDDKALYLVMDYVEGPTLAAMMRKERIPQPVVLRIIHDALLGLHAAHELCDEDGEHLEVVHRDVSPQNILVGLDGVSRVMDFGIAKARSRASITEEGVVKGKLAYMAPEQIESARVDCRADIFAVGVVLWELLVFKRLFRGSSPQETLGRVLQGVVTPPSEVDAAVPSELDPMVLCALSRAPTDRFASALEFAHALVASGVPMAPVSEVASYVDKHFGEKLRARREELTRAATKSGAKAFTDAVASADKSAVQRIGRGRTPRSRWWVLGAATLVTVAGAGALWAALHTDEPSVAPLPPLSTPLAPTASLPLGVTPPPTTRVDTEQVAEPVAQQPTRETRRTKQAPRAEARRPAVTMESAPRPRIQPIDDGEW